MKTVIAAFVMLVSTLAFFAWNARNNAPDYKGAGHVTYRVVIPTRVDDNTTREAVESAVAVYGRTMRPCPPSCDKVIVTEKRTHPSGEGVFIKADKGTAGRITL